MDWLVAVVVVLVILIVLVAALKARSRGPEDYPYTKKRVLFSPAERSFLGVLEQAVGREYRVFGKVRVADVIEPQRGLDGSRRQKAFNRTQAKHFDFVLCAHSDLSVVCAIELDDQSHQAPKRQERDAFLARLCQAVSLPLLQIPARRAYSVPELRAHVLAAMGVQLEAMPESRKEPVPERGAVDESPAPSCPTCSAIMVRRRAKTGTNAGEGFWGCSRFPACRATKPVNI
jgi:hypothetical protein